MVGIKQGVRSMFRTLQGNGLGMSMTNGQKVITFCDLMAEAFLQPN